MNPSKNFALIGAGGYVAPRHIQAIHDSGNRLVAALDPNDSVGILDKYSEDVAFFTEFERFDRHAEKLRRQSEDSRLHYVSICSPNYLHDAHIRFALRIGADAICEKPLVLNPWNIDALAQSEQETGGSIYNILQLRVHPSIIELRERVAREGRKEKHKIDLTYVTSRGPWYLRSWKGDVNKSGGVATNIGVHFFDMLLWIFGACEHQELYSSDQKRMAGFLELEAASVRWFLSINQDDIPESAANSGQSTYRSIRVDDEEFEFSSGFGDLHTMVYQDILSGDGFGLEDVRPAIDLVHKLRSSDVVRARGDRVHPLLVSEDLKRGGNV